MTDHATNAEVSDLVAKYADYCDQGNWDAVVGLFTTDGTFDAESVYGKTMTGHDELTAFFTSAPSAVGHHPSSFYCTEAAESTVSVRMKMLVVFRSGLFSVDYSWLLKRIDDELRIDRQEIALVGKMSLAQRDRVNSDSN